jgi:ABC-type uncharacterized transport system permease subunit
MRKFMIGALAGLAALATVAGSAQASCFYTWTAQTGYVYVCP